MREKTVNFNDENSWDDFDIVFKSLTIGGSEPQLVLINVPFRNGSLDETDYFGDVRYKDRQLTMDFLIPWEADDQHSIYSKVQNKLNGQRKKISFSADEDWYYEGRLSVGEMKIDNGFFAFTITATADPFKYHDSFYEYEITESTEITLPNDFMKTVPNITVSDVTTIAFGGSSEIVSEGTHRYSGFIMEEGDNVFTIAPHESATSSPITVAFNYKQGRL